jgi:phage terminase small subunit
LTGEKMTDPTRYRLFARHFLVLLDASKAAVEAGYSPTTAKQTGSRLLKHPVVQRELEKLRARQERRLERKLDDILDELDLLASARMSDYAGLLAAADPVEYLATMDPEEAAAIKSVSFETWVDKKGKEHRRIKDFTLYDKRAALVDLGLHRGMRRGRVQIEQVPPAQRPDVSMLDAEDREALRKICDKMVARQAAPQIEGKAEEVEGSDG